jgi:hypothetical protein
VTRGASVDSLDIISSFSNNTDPTRMGLILLFECGSKCLTLDIFGYFEVSHRMCCIALNAKHFAYITVFKINMVRLAPRAMVLISRPV